MKLVYDIHDKPEFGKLIMLAFQQLLAIMAATLVVPVIVGNGMSPAAALFGAGIGTLVYVLFTKRRSPVFLGSSFAFLGSMAAAFAGGVSMSLGYLGIILGAIFAGLVYVVLAIIVKLAGVGWINKLMPAVVIGPTVAIIGLSLAGNAIGDLTTPSLEGGSPYVAIICGLITLFSTITISSYGSKTAKLIPFIIGIISGYIAASIFYLIGMATNNPALQIIDYSPFSALFANGVQLSSFVDVPDFTFLTAVKGFGELEPTYVGTIAVAYIPVAFVAFAEHLADHKNISTIVNRDLLEDPGLSRTLLGDGVGSMAGALFGGCPNTTYGESIACVAVTGNASIATIVATAIMAIVISFLTPFVAVVNSIPSCVMGGVCMTLYGFIAVSGLRMFKHINLDRSRNLYVVSVILITGIGGMTVSFGKVTLTEIACALILGIITNLILSKKTYSENEPRPWEEKNNK